MACLKKRGTTYYAQYYVGKKQRRVSLKTDSYQVARAKLREIENRLAQGDDNPLPTKTPIADLLQAYAEHVRTHKTPKSAQADVYYLREMFGPVCDALKITSRTPSAKARKRKPKPGQDRRVRPPVVEAAFVEAITTADLSEFIDAKVRRTGIAPKTANRYREITCRMFNWATETGRIRLPQDKNPAAAVPRYKERAPEIRFLTLPQIDEQLHALRFKPQLQAMVATLIYAGLRREELLWLTMEDMDFRRGTSGGHGLIRIRAKTIGSRSWQPKTKRNRAVPISRALREHLDRYTPPASDHGWYFPSPYGTWWDPDNFSADLRDANKDAGLPWTCLDFRHTFGSQLAQNGVSLYKIATLLGNSPEICRRHYAALVPELISSEIDFGSPTACDQLLVI
ncbi:tyrosine-type recombinase/integrase [Phycisphaerales bacterium AB-hyl4]|uniref:Tyrosine-type recombinase/integrase n=1 Tax=Natronomicrosphaera hydrolytica TaxID=3242702 RepID=A0ABV4U347_9BACT